MAIEDFRTAFDDIASEFSEAQATVVINGTSVTGLLARETDGGNFDLENNDRTEIGAVRVRYDQAGDVNSGDSITVNGSEVWVINSVLDAMGVVMRIEYQKTRPYDGGPIT